MHTDRQKRMVAIWLLTGVAMIIVQTLLGGITRLTGSGLSITEWKPIMGAIPPLNEEQWRIAFQQYQQIGQYKFLNTSFQLDDFKFIFFWEWFHRLWARMLGVVFLTGFTYFLLKGYFTRALIRPLIILFLLGALQGLIGWVMVASGVNKESLFVDHVKLSVHFIAAMVLACYTLWFALKLLIPEQAAINNKTLRNLTYGIIALLFVQLTYGAFMAGLKAAMAAPTWPDINGTWIPQALLHNNLVSDRINVHFIHRTLAYLLLVLITTWFVLAIKNTANNKWLKGGTTTSLLLVTLQVTLGIVTLLAAPTIRWGKFGTYETLAELHQLVAMFLLMSLVYNAYILRKDKKSLKETQISVSIPPISV